MSSVNSQKTLQSGRLTFREQIRVVTRFGTYYRPHWTRLILVFLVTPLTGAILSALIPILSIILIDEIIPRGNYLWVFLFVTIAVVVTLIRDGNFLLEGFIRFYLKMEILREMGRDLFSHMLSMSMSFHSEHPVGERIFRTFTDTHDAARMLGVSLPTAIAMLLQGLTVTAITLFIDWRPAIAIAVFFPPYVLLTEYITRIWRRQDQYMREGRANVTSHLQETYANIPVVKAAAQEDEETVRYTNRLKPFLKRLYAWIVCEGLQEGLVHPAGLAIIFSVLTGFMLGYLHIVGQLTLGQWVALQGLIAGGLIPLAQVVLHYQTLCREMVAAQRVLQIIEMRSAVPEPVKPVPIHSLRGHVEVDNVTFNYSGEDPVLQNLSFSIEPGEHVVLVGHSGCGKSTVLALLLRFYDPVSGVIRIDERDLLEIDIDACRHRMGVVLQSAQVFSGTVRENLTFGADAVSEEAIEKALRLADCTDFVAELPQGLETIMDEGGNLSGGQRQRLTIARALAREPDILILDEPLASVDIDSELRIFRAIHEEFLGRTVIIATHSPESVTFADRMIFLDKGRVIASGTYQDLKDKGLI